MKYFYWLVLAIFTLNAQAQRKTYYVSNDGTGNGSSTQAPMSISSINSTALIAGDSVLLKADDVFPVSLLIKYSGSPNNPIVFSRYGTGGNPKISLLTTISSWDSLGGNLWKSNKI